MYTLDEIAQHHGTDKSTKFHGYAPIYDRLFAPLRLKPVRLLEIGVADGASIKTWLDYFPAAQVVGVDISPIVAWADPRYRQLAADQTSPEQMANVARDHGPFDIVIDDGCHLASAALVSFTALWPAVVSGGYYIIEDVGTYWHPMYQSACEGWTWLHGFVDDVQQRGKNFHGVPWRDLPLSPLEETIKSVFFSKGLAILEKA